MSQRIPLIRLPSGVVPMSVNPVYVQGIVQGAGVEVDSSVAAFPVISATGGSGGKLEYFTPELTNAPAVFTTVADGFGDAVISNNGLTVSTESSSGGFVTSNAGGSVVTADEVGFVFKFDPAAFEEIAGHELVFGFGDGVPGAETVMVGAAIGGGAIRMIGGLSNTMSPGTTPLTGDEDTVWLLTIQLVGSYSVLRLYNDLSPTTPLLEWQVVDGDDNPVDCSAANRLLAITDASTVFHLVNDSGVAFDYTPIQVPVISKPTDCAGRAFEYRDMSAPIPTPFGDMDNGKVGLYNIAGDFIGFLVGGL